jgi:hypothetical protein
MPGTGRRLLLPQLATQAKLHAEATKAALLG